MSTSYSPKIVTDGLVLALDAANVKSYPRSGTAWTDLSGNNNTGTLTNGPTFSGENGGSIVFDGTNDSVENSATTASFPLNNFTYEVWCRPTTTHEIDTESTTGFGGTSGQRYLIFANYDDISPYTTPGAGISVGTNGVSVYEHTSGYMPALLVSSTTISSTVATHIIVTYTSKQPRLYLNAALIRTGLTSTKTNVRGDFRSIGGGAYGFFQGAIYSAKVYNRTLSANEVLQNFNATRNRFGV